MHYDSKQSSMEFQQHQDMKSSRGAHWNPHKDHPCTCHPVLWISHPMGKPAAAAPVYADQPSRPHESLSRTFLKNNQWHPKNLSHLLYMSLKFQRKYIIYIYTHIYIYIHICVCVFFMSNKSKLLRLFPKLLHPTDLVTLQQLGH